jgi:two-component system, NarL family, sensor kinase
MKKALILLLLLGTMLPIPLRAQYEVLPAERQTALKALKNEQVRIDTLVNWAYETADKALERLYVETALVQAGRAAYPAGRSDAFVKLGHIAADAGQYAEAEKLYRKALHLRDSLGLIPGVASCYNNLGQLQKNQGHYKEAVALFEQGLEQLSPDDAPGTQAALYNNLGAALWGMADCEQGYAHFKTAMRLGQRLKVPFWIASARFNMGALLQDCQGHYGQAMDSLRLCLQDFTQLNDYGFMAKCHLLIGNNAYFIGEMEQALEQYQQAAALGQYLAKTERAILTKNRGRVYLDQQRYQEALRDFTTALDSFTAIGNAREVAATRYELGNYHYEKSEFAAAIPQYKLALDTALSDPMLKGNVLLFLPDALDQLGRTKEANAYREEYKRFMERMDSTKSRVAWRRLMLNGLSKKAVVTRIERADRQAEKNKLHGILGLLGVFLTISTAGFFLHRQKRRLAEIEAQNAEQRTIIALQTAEQAEKDREIAQQNEQIAIQEKLELIQSKEMDTYYARLDAQDELQKKIGRELHDGVGTMLTAVKLNLSPVDEVVDQFPSKRQAQYSTANRLLDEACQELRRISHELGSAILAQFGLKAQLEAFANILRNTGKYEVELGLHALEGRFDKKTEINLYRIVQELVSNVIKHAQASKISISASHFDNMINIIVEDNGKGFDESKALTKPGMGFISLQARVHGMEGQMFIDTQIGRGTSVSVDVPLFPMTV